jgi:ribosomal protein S20
MQPVLGICQAGLLEPVKEHKKAFDQTIKNGEMNKATIAAYRTDIKKLNDTLEADSKSSDTKTRNKVREMIVILKGITDLSREVVKSPTPPATLHKHETEIAVLWTRFAAMVTSLS